MLIGEILFAGFRPTEPLHWTIGWAPGLSGGVAPPTAACLGQAGRLGCGQPAASGDEDGVWVQYTCGRGAVSGRGAARARWGGGDPPVTSVGTQEGGGIEEDGGGTESGMR